MQRFTLIHDGTVQGWRTTYLAFHVAARLGAPLKVLLVNADTGQETSVQRAAQVKVGGRAAGLEIETAIISEFSPDILSDYTPFENGLFIPRRLVAGTDTMARLSRVIDCPLWIVSEESETRKMAVLVDNLAEDEAMIVYASMLSQRLGEKLTGLYIDGSIPPTLDPDQDLEWMALRDGSTAAVNDALEQLQIELLILGPSHHSLVDAVNCSCVVYNPREVRA